MDRGRLGGGGASGGLNQGVLRAWSLIKDSRDSWDTSIFSGISFNSLNTYFSEIGFIATVKRQIENMTKQIRDIFS